MSTKSALTVIFVNLVAIAAGGLVILLDGESHVLWTIGIADLLATVVIWIFGTLYRNSSMYDPWWSVAPPLIVIFWWVQSAGIDNPMLRKVLISVLVLWYGIRLTFNWARGWTGMDHEDWRYVDLRKKTKQAWPLVNLTGIHIFPTIQVFLGCLPIYAAFMLESRGFNILDVLAIMVTAGGILLEAIADRQLLAYKKQKKAGTLPESVTFLKTGVWAWMRHPNYLGEILVWWGIFLFGLAAGMEYWWTGIGTLTITIMFRFISLPMIDKRMAANKPGYKEHMKILPGLLPGLGK